MSPIDAEIPPVGEEVHLPDPTLLPLLLAVGITLALVGVTISPILLVGGAILTVAVFVRWVRDVRQDMDQLPLDHS